MKTNKIRMRRMVWALLAGASALLLATGLSLLLSHFQALAQPAAEVAADDLVVDKEVNTALAAPGDTLVYTITIENNSTSSIDGWMTDTLPTELTSVSGLTALLGSVGFENGVITWSHTLAALQWDRITFSADISSEVTYANVVNTAQVTGTGKLIESSAATWVGEVGNLDNPSTYKAVSSDTAEPGDVLTYTIRVTNDDTDLVPDAWFTDTLPAELIYIPGSLSTLAGNAGFENGVITWSHTLGGLSYDEVSFSAQISPDLPYDNWITNTVEIVAPSQSFTRASGTYIHPGVYYRYFPIIFKRWPPIPYAPTLNNIDNTDEDGDYTVSWSYNDDNPDVPDPITYTLQEATDADFTGPTEYYPGSSTSYAFSSKDDGTYYYRVQGHNEHGPGEWSNVKSTTVVSPDFFDDFSNSGSGWTTHAASCCLSGCDSARQHLNYKYNLYYGGGRYHVNIPLDCRASGGNHGDTRHIYPVLFAPGVERSTSETCIELKGRFEEWDPYWSFWGLVFAASDDMSTVYSLEVNNIGDWGIVKRTDYQYPGPNHPFENETREPIVSYTGEQQWPAKAGSNTLMVRVTNQKVKAFINGYEVYSFSSGEIPSLRRVGIIGGDWEITPTQIGYDYFFVDEGCDDY